jgi:farnesyl diphosphate synthase
MSKNRPVILSEAEGYPDMFTPTLQSLLNANNSTIEPSQREWLGIQFAEARAWIEAQITDSLESAWGNQSQQLGDQPDVQHSLKRLFDAAKHACLLGGKRVRPLLAMLVGQAIGIQHASTLKGLVIACELIHAQSLVFDDLPCMDDDAMRRGKPTTHVAFDEATAVLVGDGLACHAYEALVKYTPLESTSGGHETHPYNVLTLVKELGGVGSFNGLVNGQYADIYSGESPPTIEHLRYIHANKTGALLRYAILSPAWLLGKDQAILTPLDGWARGMGQLFQLVDDVLDATQDSEQLGKTAGKDAEQDKLTYVSLLGLDGARAEISRLNDEASVALDVLAQQGVDVSLLRDFQTFLCHRKS